MLTAKEGGIVKMTRSKILTKCSAAALCATLFFGMGLSAFAADKVDIDTSTAKSAGGYYEAGGDGWWAMWQKTDEISINSIMKADSSYGDITADSVVTVDGKKATFVRKETVSGCDYYIFSIKDTSTTTAPATTQVASTVAATVKTPEQAYSERQNEKKNEIINTSRTGKNIDGTKTIEVRDGDSVSSDMMETIADAKDITVQFYYTRGYEHFRADITPEAAKKAPKVEWAGPLFLQKYFHVTKLD